MLGIIHMVKIVFVSTTPGLIPTTNSYDDVCAKLVILDEIPEADGNN